jgi:hypothetical protein
MKRRKAMSKEVRKTTIPHNVVRLEIEVKEAYDDFCRRYESAVPMWNRDRGVEFMRRKAPWSEVLADVAASAPYDFLIYWKMDLTPLMSLAGNTWRCTEYLMGNHIIAETMYRHDPAVGLYVPLRVAIYAGADGRTRFAIDQPSTALSSLGVDAITQVGIDLDRKLARLLDALGTEVPAILSAAA